MGGLNPVASMDISGNYAKPMKTFVVIPSWENPHTAHFNPKMQISMLNFKNFINLLGAMAWDGFPTYNPNLVPILKPMASPLTTTQPQKKIYRTGVKTRVSLAQNMQCSQLGSRYFGLPSSTSDFYTST